MDRGESLNLAINTLTMRHQVLLRAVCALVQSQPEQVRAAFASEIQSFATALLQNAADLMSPDMDALVTGDVLALQSAAQRD